MASPPPPALDLDDEWEYEYSTTETEDHFVLLDLSSALPPRPKTKPAPSRRPTAARDQDATPASAPDTPQEARDASPDEPAADIEILDLHTSNPIISYQHQVFSCTWANTLGTDLIFAAPDTIDDSITALRSTPDYDLVAVTSTRLIGRPVTLVPKRQPSSPGRDKSQTDPQDDSSSVQESQNEDRPFKIPVNASAGRQRHEQAHFLERLMAIKKARGETDDVTVYTSRGGRKPGPGRPQARAEDAQVGGRIESSTRPANRGRRGRPRGRPRKRARTFFDHEIDVGHTATTASIPTPRTWTELDSAAISVQNESPTMALPSEEPAVASGSKPQDAQRTTEVERQETDIAMPDAP